MASLRKTLFENLLLFDTLSPKVTGESIPISLLIGALGRKGLDALIEQRAIEFVLWNENVGFLVKNIPGVDGMVSMAHNTPEYVDPEISIDSGLKWAPDAPQGRERRVQQQNDADFNRHQHVLEVKYHTAARLDLPASCGAEVR